MYASRGQGEYSHFWYLCHAHIAFVQPAPETEEHMMVEIMKYTDRVVGMVRPRKLLFMAIGAYSVHRVHPCVLMRRRIDGVAPRAKMNQQRSRRFRSAQEAKEKEEAHKAALIEWEGEYLDSSAWTVFEKQSAQLEGKLSLITRGTRNNGTRTLSLPEPPSWIFSLRRSGIGSQQR